MPTTDKPLSSTIAAELLLARARKDAPADVSPMQLLKLVYIAHGVSLGIYGDPLISDRIEAWKFGPVIPNLYRQIRHCGNNSVPSGTLASLDHSHPPTPQQEVVIDAVWQAYGGMSGAKLSAITHQPNTPWDIVWNKNRGSTFRGAQIDNQLIEEFYKKLLNG